MDALEYVKKYNIPKVPYNLAYLAHTLPESAQLFVLEGISRRARLENFEHGILFSLSRSSAYGKVQKLLLEYISSHKRLSNYLVKLAGNQALDKDVQGRIFSIAESDSLQYLANNPVLDKEIENEMATALPTEIIQTILAWRPNIDSKTVDILLDSKFFKVKEVLARNPNLNYAQLLHLAQDPTLLPTVLHPGPRPQRRNQGKAYR